MFHYKSFLGTLIKAVRESVAMGGREPVVTDDMVLSVFETRSEPFFSTAEIAENLPVTRRTTLNRLRRLEQAGTVRSKTIGGRNTIWWHPSIESNENGSGGRPTASSHTYDRSTQTDAVDLPATLIERIDTVAQETLPGSGSKQAERKAALTAVVEYLCVHGQGTPAEFREHIYPQYSGGYQSAQSWWKNCIYKGLRELSDRCSEIERADTTGEWTYKPNMEAE